jgi:hypothetical protein
LIIWAAPPQVAQNLRIKHAVILAIGELSITGLAPGEAKPQGTTLVERLKAVDVDTEKPVDLAFGEKGEPVNPNQLPEALHKRRFQKFGRIHETLWKRIEGRPFSEEVNVIMRLCIAKDIPRYDKEAPKEGIPRRRRASRMKFTQCEKLSWTNFKHWALTSHLYSVPTDLRGILVYTHTRVPIEQLQTLAEHEAVGVVLYNDQSAEHHGDGCECGGI